jgi:hypothetical protein
MANPSLGVKNDVQDTGVAGVRGVQEWRQRIGARQKLKLTAIPGTGVVEGFLDLLDCQAVGLIVRLVEAIVVALKGEQLLSVSFSDHLDVNATFHPGFQARNAFIQPRKQTVEERTASVILFGVAKLVRKNPSHDTALHPCGVLSAYVQMNLLTLKPYGHHEIVGVEHFEL